MKQQINEIKRMQQLAGIISESQLNEETKAPKGFSEITSFTKLKVGNDIMGKHTGRIAKITAIKDDNKYAVIYDDEGQKATLTKDKLESNFWVSLRK